MKRIAFFPCLLLAICCIINLSSCKSTAIVAGETSIEQEQLPPDMATEPFILIGILKDRKSYDKHMEKQFKKYTGEYVLATLKEVDSQYADVNKYRYIMDSKETLYDRGAGRDHYTGRMYSFYIIDRKEGHTYNHTRGSITGSISVDLEVKSYLRSIEAFRKK